MRATFGHDEADMQTYCLACRRGRELSRHRVDASCLTERVNKQAFVPICWTCIDSCRTGKIDGDDWMRAADAVNCVEKCSEGCWVGRAQAWGCPRSGAVKMTWLLMVVAGVMRMLDGSYVEGCQGQFCC